MSQILIFYIHDYYDKKHLAKKVSAVRDLELLHILLLSQTIGRKCNAVRDTFYSVENSNSHQCGTSPEPTGLEIGGDAAGPWFLLLLGQW